MRSAAVVGVDDGAEALRSSWQGQLWTAVLASGYTPLVDAIKFFDSGYENGLALLRRQRFNGYMGTDGKKRCLSEGQFKARTEKLEWEHRHYFRFHKRELNGVVEFFYGEDSPFELICDLLGYDQDKLRDRADRLWREAMDRIRHEAPEGMLRQRLIALAH